MSILITGGAGYIGSHIVRQLSEQGLDVIVYDNLSTGYASSLLHNEKLIIADLLEISSLQKVFQENKISTVLHLAASVVVPESIRDPLHYYFNNVLSTLNLLRTCIQHQVNKFIFSSTAMVYSAQEQNLLEEASPTNPKNPYGKTKLMCEHILADLEVAHDLRYVCLRYFNVAGADPLFRIGQRGSQATHLIKTCCQVALGKKDYVPIYGTNYPTPDGTAIRDYVHVEDIVHAHLAALDYLNADGKSVSLNVGYGKGSSVKEVIAVAKKITNQDFPVISTDPRPGDAIMLVANNNKILKTLNWQPRYMLLEKMIEDAWRWEQKL